MEFLINLFKWLRNLLTPPKAFSWQTLILLSLFSYIMSYLATGLVENMLANFGWIFLIVGVGWGTSRDKRLYISGVPLSPWITGALVCIFIFGNFPGANSRLALISWPPVSAFIAALPEFFDKRLILKLPPPASRQKLVIMFGSNLLVSCWFQFYFVMQSWVQEYPSVLVDDFSKSTFAVNLESQPNVTPRGALILDLMEPQLSEQLDNKPWSEVERWLLERENQLAATRKQVLKEVPKAEEDVWWDFKSEVLSSKSGYNLQLREIWKGPRSQPENYVIEKTCMINQVYPQPDTDTKPVEANARSGAIAQVQCYPASPPRWQKSK